MTVGETKVAIVMGDHEDGFPLGLEVREQSSIKEVLKGWILVGGPFVEHQDGPAFK